MSLLFLVMVLVLVVALPLLLLLLLLLVTVATVVVCWWWVVVFLALVFARGVVLGGNPVCAAFSLKKIAFLVDASQNDLRAGHAIRALFFCFYPFW